jgi:hypothetical protein
MGCNAGIQAVEIPVVQRPAKKTLLPGSFREAGAKVEQENGKELKLEGLKSIGGLTPSNDTIATLAGSSSPAGGRLRNGTSLTPSSWSRSSSRLEKEDGASSPQQRRRICPTSPASLPTTGSLLRHRWKTSPPRIGKESKPTLLPPTARNEVRALTAPAQLSELWDRPTEKTPSVVEVQQELPGKGSPGRSTCDIDLNKTQQLVEQSSSVLGPMQVVAEHAGDKQEPLGAESTPCSAPCSEGYKQDIDSDHLIRKSGHDQNTGDSEPKSAMRCVPFECELNEVDSVVDIATENIIIAAQGSRRKSKRGSTKKKGDSSASTKRVIAKKDQTGKRASSAAAKKSIHSTSPCN